MACLQNIVSATAPPLPAEEALGMGSNSRQTSTIPFMVDPEHQKFVECTAQEDGSLMAMFDCAVPGYFIGQTPLTAGKYVWKVGGCG
jgi:hypothetical protein